MHFTEAKLLLLALLLIWPLFRWRGEKISKFSHIGLLPKDKFSTLFVALKKAVLITVAAAIIIALANPVRDGGEIERLGRGSSIVFVLDMSVSMESILSTDSKKYKSVLSEDVISRFVAKRCRKDRAALIGFGSMPILFSDFTYDCGVFEKVLKARGADLGGTVIGWPLHNAIVMLDNLEVSGKAIVLVSDGDGSMEEMDELVYGIKKLGIKFYWVSIDESNAINLTRFIDLLGSGYAEKFVVTHPEDLDDAFRRIDRLESGPVKYKEFRPLISWRPYFLIVAFTLLVVGLLLAMFDFNLERALKRSRKVVKQ